MHFRRKAPRAVSLDQPYNSPQDAKPARREYGTRDGRLETSVTRVALNRAISELPESCRAIFLLHEVEGYQHREIAELLGCSVGNSKSRLHKAKLQIRDFLVSTPSKSQPAGAAEQWDPAARGSGIEMNTMPRLSPSNA